VLARRCALVKYYGSPCRLLPLLGAASGGGERAGPIRALLRSSWRDISGTLTRPSRLRGVTSGAFTSSSLKGPLDGTSKRLPNLVTTYLRLVRFIVLWPMPLRLSFFLFVPPLLDLWEEERDFAK